MSPNGMTPEQWQAAQADMRMPRNVTDFTPDETKIFQYAGVWYDPLELNHRLQVLLGGRAEELIRDYCKKGRGGAEAWAALDQVKHAILTAFDFPPFDPQTGTGTTYSVWDGALEAYLDFFRRCATSTDTMPTCAPPSESPDSSPEESPLATTSACG